MSDMRSEGPIPAPLPDSGGVAPACGPVFDLAGTGLQSDELCACGCTAYGERCGRWHASEWGESHPCCA